MHTRKTVTYLSGAVALAAMLAFSMVAPSGGAGYPPTSIPGSPDLAPGTAVTTIGGVTVTAQLSAEKLLPIYKAVFTNGFPNLVAVPSVLVTIKAGTAGLGLGTTYSGSATYDPNNSIVTLSNGVTVDLAGFGLKPGTIVFFTLYSSGLSLGSTTVAADGTYSYAITIPPGISQGAHTLAAKGTAKNGKPFKLSVGVKVTAKKTFTVGPFASGHSVSGSLSASVQELAALIKDQHKTHVVLTGYCDSTGTVAGNRAESIDRARAVATQLSADLAAFKVKGVKIVARGGGTSHPVVSNANATRRVLNRRVVATLS